ncbi:hypothetical protein CcaverHIS631_0405170 [Cutaneotrichosporon cavernicola]|nr:hypothetical protein CcaverHIS631_0405170 [Cutaneotrichosporon cavernicola]BEJ07252.1 hypothetical protein CcaverHIS641_0405210 [Cutaneotrichosporon cavernicola]
MSVLRRSSSPLSSASPSPPQVPTGASTAPLTALNLGPSAAADDEPGIVGGSSPTTLTEPLTESDLTEDEEEMDEPTNELVTPDDDALDALSDIGDEDEADGDAAAITHARHSPEGSPLSPSPSLTPPPPSDPPHPEALPSSPSAAADVAHGATIVEPHDDDDDDDDDDAVLADNSAPEDRGASKAGEDSGDEELTPAAEEADGDITMRAADAADEAAAENDDAVEALDSSIKQEAGDGDIDLEDEHAEAEVQAEEAPEEAEEEAEAEAEEEADETDAADTATVLFRAGHSSHAPLPTPAAIRALFALEVKFAALRDRLYVERLEEAAREEEMVLNGTHPALVQLNHTLQTRRERLHEVASRRHQESIKDLCTWRKIEDKISWSTWTDQRDQLHWDEFEATWSKRRRLAREKNELETPKVHRPVPRVDRPPKPFDWSAGAVPPRLSAEDALRDLRLMDARRLQQQQQQAASRHASPMYGSYAQPSTSMYPYQAAQHPANFLQGDQAHADRRHLEAQTQRPPQQSHRQPAASQHAAQPHAPPPEVSRMPAASAAGPSRPQPQASQRKVDPYSIPPRREVPAQMPAQTNGDGRMNGHAARQAPRPLAAAAGSAAPAQSATDTKPVVTSAAQPERPASRYPGFTDFLSGGSAPQNSFQHHLNAPSKPAQAGNSSPAPGAPLVRPAFSPQVPAGSAQRS